MLSHVVSLAGHSDEVLCVHSPGNERLVSGGAEGSVRLWDVAAGRASRALLLPSADRAGGVTAVCAGSTGAAANWVYAAAATHVYGWDLRVPGVLVREPACAFNNLARDEIGHIALHEESGALAVADDASDVHIVDVGSMAAAPGSTSGAIMALRGVHTSICTWVAFRPGLHGNECCTAGLDALCVRWDWRIAAKLEAWPLASPGSAFAATLNSAADAASATAETSAAASAEPTQLLNPRHAHCVSFTSDGGCAALALGDGSVEVRIVAGGEPICAVDAHRAACSQAHFAPALAPALALRAAAPNPLDDVVSAFAELGTQGVPLVSAGDDRQVRLWTVEGVMGRGDAGARDAKRRRHHAGAAEMEEEEEEEEALGEPGFRALAGVRLRHKPNCVTVAAEAGGSGRAVVCVATTGDAIEVLSV